MAAGAPTKYNPKIHLPLALKLAKNGMLDTQIADCLGIVSSTYYEWLKKYPELSETIKKGKEEVDQKVIKSLLKNAMGFKYKEHVIEKNKEGKIILDRTITKESLPQTTAQIFWLKNRQRQDWRDRWEIDGLSEALKDGIKVKISDGN